ncbi:MAG: hypothetical protein R3E79_45705 [Caldilineaceae bacterium]
MGLFRTRPKPATAPISVTKEKAPVIQVSSSQPDGTQSERAKTAPSDQQPSKSILQELGIYVLPNEFKVGFRKIREEVQRFLVEENHSAAGTSPAKLRELVEPVYTKALTEANLVVSRVDRTRMLDMIIADIAGFGPIQPLLDRDDITEVMVNGPSQIYIEHRASCN